MILPETNCFTGLLGAWTNAAASPQWVWALDAALHLPSTVDAMHRRTLSSCETNEGNDVENAGTFQRKARFIFFWECYKVGKYQPRIIHPSPRGCLRKGYLGRGSTLSVANNKGLSKKVSNHIWNTRTLGIVSTCTTKHAFGTHVQSKEANQQQEEQKQQQSIAEETNDSVALPLLYNCATWIWISNFSYTNEKQLRTVTVRLSNLCRILAPISPQQKALRSALLLGLTVPRWNRFNPLMDTGCRSVHCWNSQTPEKLMLPNGSSHLEKSAQKQKWRWHKMKWPITLLTSPS